jgi:hypothetical protein
MDVKEAIEVCRNDPEQLRELGPPLFEAVIAELLAGFGWEVSLTPPTRDGGYDILGVTADASGLKTSWVVECKRYAADNKVGVEIARQLAGVMGHIGVPNAVIVTTSSFTTGVREFSAEAESAAGFAQAAMHQLQARDCWTLSVGIREGQKIPFRWGERAADRRRCGDPPPCGDRRRRSCLHVGGECGVPSREWGARAGAGGLVPAFSGILSLLPKPAAATGGARGFDQYTKTLKC